MDEDDSLRGDILQFIESFYEESGEAPSVSEICRRIDGVYREKFYQLFKGRISEACRAAGVPVPDDRVKSTEKATEEKEKPKKAVVETGLSLKLNPEQTRRIYGVSHLERSKDPSLLIDEMLSRDELIRSFGLTLNQEPSLYAHARALALVPQNVLGDMITMVYELNNLGWDISEFMSEVKKSASLLSISVKYLLGEISPEAALLELKPR